MILEIIEITFISLLAVHQGHDLIWFQYKSKTVMNLDVPDH